MRLLSERPTCPRRDPVLGAVDWLRCPQAEEVSEMIWHTEELDADLPLGWCMGIAHEAHCP